MKTPLPFDAEFARMYEEALLAIFKEQKAAIKNRGESPSKEDGFVLAALLVGATALKIIRRQLELLKEEVNLNENLHGVSSKRSCRSDITR